MEEKVNKILGVMVTIMAFLIYARKSAYYLPDEVGFVMSENIYFHDPESEALFFVLNQELEASGVHLDRRWIAEICMVDEIPDDKDVRGMYYRGSILLVRGNLKEDFDYAYWVFAHEVLHSQGFIRHDSSSFLMTENEAGYRAIKMFGFSVTETINAVFMDYFDVNPYYKELNRE